MRLSHDVGQNVAYFNLLTMQSRSLIYVAIGSQFSLNYLANTSCSKMIATKLRGVGDKFATGSGHPRRLCVYFASNFVA